VLNASTPRQLRHVQSPPPESDLEWSEKLLVSDVESFRHCMVAEHIAAVVLYHKPI